MASSNSNSLLNFVSYITDEYQAKKNTASQIKKNEPELKEESTLSLKAGTTLISDKPFDWIVDILYGFSSFLDEERKLKQYEFQNSIIIMIFYLQELQKLKILQMMNTFKL